MTKKGISVIIPNYNGGLLLAEILPCLYIALKNSKQAHEVLVCDDSSTDNSIQLLQTSFPEVTVLKNEINKGFSPTINKGIFAAKYDFILLLNSDVKLTPDYFDHLLRYFEKSDTFGVMGRIIGWNDETIQDAAKYPSFHGAKIKTTGNYYPIEPAENGWLYSMYLSGANAFVDRNKLLQLGGFNEIYAPFYVEDFDLSLRAWRLGWKCYYEHFAVCRHQVSVSIKSSNRKKFINTIYYRNKMFLHAIHLSGLNLAIWYLQLIPESIIRLCTLRFYYFNSIKMFFAGGDKVRTSRKTLLNLAIEKKFLLSVREVVLLIQDSIKNKSIKRF